MRTNSTAGPRTRGGVLAVLAGIVLVATFVRVGEVAARMGAGIVRISGDEFVYIQLGDRIWREGRYTAAGLEADLAAAGVTPPAYLASPVFKHPPVFPALVGASRILGGGSVGAAYWPVFALSAISIAAVFGLSGSLGHSDRTSLLAAGLWAVSPVHVIASTRVWLDLPAACFMLLALWATVAAVVRPRWWAVAAVCWIAALLTKYVIAVPWLISVATSLWIQEDTRRSRAFWLSHAAIVLVVGAWAAFQIASDEVGLFSLATSSIDDWRALGRAVPRLAVAGLVALALVLAARWSSPRLRFTARPGTLIVLSAALAAMTIAWGGLGASLWDMPQAGWLSNPFASSPPDFYVTRQILFEPVLLLTGPALLHFHARRAHRMLIWPWAALFVFLTAWGNYQMRYALPLVPVEIVLAAGFVGGVFADGESGRIAKVVGACWVLLSLLRSLTILGRMGTDVFYF